MQIRVNLKILIIILIFLLARKLDVYLILMAFAIIHEIGHLAIGILLGFKPKKIEILPVGVSASFYMNCQNYNKKIINGNILAVKKIAIALAGPVTSFCLGMLFYYMGISIFNIENDILVYSNILIGMFNLIPIYPLDGGRIVKNILHIFKGLENSYKYTNMISNVTIILFTIISSFLVLAYKNISILIILTYLWGIIIIQNKRFAEKKRIYNVINSNENYIKP